jgi:hypothetical protein
MPPPLQCMPRPISPSHHLTILLAVPASCRGFLAALAVLDASQGRARIAAPYPAPCSNIGLLGLVSWLVAATLHVISLRLVLTVARRLLMTTLANSTE